MPFKIKLTNAAKKVYIKLAPKLKMGLEKCLSQLEYDPKVHRNIKKLKGYDNDYRYKVGRWRIMYEIDEAKKLVIVYEIGPRGDIYKHSH